MHLRHLPKKKGHILTKKKRLWVWAFSSLAFVSVIHLRDAVLAFGFWKSDPSSSALPLHQ
jgi:hypothetical protein